MLSLGNAINHDLYGIQIALKNLPFLPGHLRNLGLLNYFPIHEMMARPVICFDQVEKVGTIYQVLKTTTHNGFPVLGANGHLVGLILRKTLCSLLKLKAYSVPQVPKESSRRKEHGNPLREDDSAHYLTILATAKSYEAPSVPSSSADDVATNTKPDTVLLAPAATVFYDTLERNYPRYPRIDSIELAAKEMVRNVDFCFGSCN